MSDTSKQAQAPVWLEVLTDAGHQPSEKPKGRNQRYRVQLSTGAAQLWLVQLVTTAMVHGRTRWWTGCEVGHERWVAQGRRLSPVHLAALKPSTPLR